MPNSRLLFQTTPQHIAVFWLMIMSLVLSSSGIAQSIFSPVDDIWAVYETGSMYPTDDPRFFEAAETMEINPQCLKTFMVAPNVSAPGVFGMPQVAHLTEMVTSGLWTWVWGTGTWTEASAAMRERSPHFNSEIECWADDVADMNFEGLWQIQGSDEIVSIS